MQGLNSHKLGLLAGVLAVFWVGCSESGNTDSESSQSVSAEAPVVASSLAPAVALVKVGEEECCTEVGKKDECWWTDAESDGVTCTKNSDCISNRCDVDEGLCECDDQTDCHGTTSGGRDAAGVCFTQWDNVKRCGPSYCNGYYVCSCWGGCEWWNIDPAFSPSTEATNQGLYCCEGTYPGGGGELGEDPLVSYYGHSSTDCVDGSGVSGATCTDATDCPMPVNPCTIRECNSGECEYPSNTGAVCTVSNADPDDCYGEDGTCNSSAACVPDFLAPGTHCGSPHDGIDDDCLNQDICNDSGVCVNDPVDGGVTCDDLSVDTYPPSCYDQQCGVADIPTNTGNGVCEAIFLSAAPNDSCGDLVDGGGDLDSGASGYAEGYLGAFTGTMTSLSTTGTTACALNDYQGEGDNCFEGATTRRLGAQGRDLVYAFEYTTDGSSADELHAYVVRVEANFSATVYASTDTCGPTQTQDWNRCLFQHKGDNSGVNPYVWEYQVNTEGNNWSWNQQCCDPGVASCLTSGYHWCERDYPDGCVGGACTGTWNYPAAPVPCGDDLTGNLSCSTPAGYPVANMAQTIIYPQTSNTGATSHTVYIYVDGVGTGDGTLGEFTLTVEKTPWKAAPCERMNDDPRVYDITDVDVSGSSSYRGNLAGVANSDHRHLGGLSGCGTYDCDGPWEGVTPSHEQVEPNAFWPAGAYFKIHRKQGEGPQTYCVRTDNTITGAIDSVIQVRQVAWEQDICSSTFGSWVPRFHGLGQDGVSFTAQEDRLYQVVVSRRDRTDTPCLAGSDCPYKLIVEEGDCP